jgi:hypothetical protein
MPKSKFPFGIECIDIKILLKEIIRFIHEGRKK